MESALGAVKTETDTGLRLQVARYACAKATELSEPHAEAAADRYVVARAVLAEYEGRVREELAGVLRRVADRRPAVALWRALYRLYRKGQETGIPAALAGAEARGLRPLAARRVAKASRAAFDAVVLAGMTE
jgi:hypothetical protein